MVDERDEVEPDPASSKSALGFTAPSEVGPTDEPEASPPASSRKTKSFSSKKAKERNDIKFEILRMGSEFVHRMLEGLRGETFMVAHWRACQVDPGRCDQG